MTSGESNGAEHAATAMGGHAERRRGEISQAGERRLVQVESVRALAALGVLTAHIWIVAHAGAHFGSLGERAVAGFGFGALIFFSLSGCLLYLPFARRDFRNGPPLLLGRYALNRVVRIFPLYYIALVAVLVLREDGGTVKEWLTFALFAENFFSDTIGQVNGVLWTVVVELHFFALLPLLAYVIARIARGSPRRAAAVIAVLILLSATWFWIGVAADRPWRDPFRMNLINYFHMLGAGMLVALARQGWEQRPPWLRGALARADVWVLAGVPFYFLFAYDYSLQPLFAFAGFLWLGAVVLPLEPGVTGRVLGWRPLAALGLTSYSIYVWQGPLLHFLIVDPNSFVAPIVTAAQDLVDSPFAGAWLVAVPISCAAGIISYLVIEKPALRLRRRWDAPQHTSLEQAHRADEVQQATALGAQASP